MDVSNSAPASGGIVVTVVGLVITAVGGLLRHAVTEHFKHRAKELERMAEIDAEIEENAKLAPLRAEIMRLSAAKNAADERAARAEYAAESHARDLEGLGEDMRRLAADKALAEQERDAALKREAEAKDEAEEWKRLALEAERRVEAEAATKREEKVTHKETHDAQGATRTPGHSGDAAGSGGRPGYRPPRPDLPRTVPPRSGKGNRDQRG